MTSPLRALCILLSQPTAKAKRHLLQEGEDGFEDHTDSALSAYDPYARQRGIYKGIKLQEDANFKEQVRKRKFRFPFCVLFDLAIIDSSFLILILFVSD